MISSNYFVLNKLSLRQAGAIENDTHGAVILSVIIPLRCRLMAQSFILFYKYSVRCTSCP